MSILISALLGTGFVLAVIAAGLTIILVTKFMVERPVLAISILLIVCWVLATYVIHTT